MHRSSLTVSLCAAAAALVMLAGNAGAQYAVSQTPALTTSPPTNIVMMMDDSGSMQWAFVPDAYGACTGTRRFNAGVDPNHSGFNALAYDPNIAYAPPVIITGSGVQQLSTSFTAALIDGFNPGGGTIDLSSGYQPTAASAPGQTNQQFSPHPSQDLVAIFAPNTPPAGASAGGVTGTCGQAYSGTGGGGGNQFGPATYTNTATGAPAYYYVYVPTLASCTSSTNDDNCYQYVRVSSTSGPGKTDERQNFANWYSFYRTRHLMIASAAASAMADPAFTQARVTWRALNSCTDMVSGNDCAGWDGNVVDNRIGCSTTSRWQAASRASAPPSTSG